MRLPLTNKSLSLFLPFVQQLDELWQSGLSNSDAYKSPDQSTAMFDRDAEGVPGGFGELGVTYRWQLQLKLLHSVKRPSSLKGAQGFATGSVTGQSL